MTAELVACACCGWVEERSRAGFICAFCGMGQVCIPFEHCLQGLPSDGPIAPAASDSLTSPSAPGQAG